MRTAIALNIDRTGTDHHATVAAWERFASGDDDVRGVPTTILSSWYRCRDVHGLDPRGHRPLVATGAQSHGTLVDPAVFAQLGGLASDVVEHNTDCLATVTDGAGWILASWGSGGVRRRGEQSNLAPSFGWSEQISGTNGMGTALVEGTAVSVCGPEHWCEALHGWSCTGVALRDEVSRTSVASLNVSTWGQQAPVLPGGVAAELVAIRRRLRSRATRDGTRIGEAVVEHDRTCDGPLLAVDVAGNVVAANEPARRLFPDVPAGIAAEPAARRRAWSRRLCGIVERSAGYVAQDPGWTGAAELGTALGGDPAEFTIVPIGREGEPIGFLLVGSSVGGTAGADVPVVEAPATGADTRRPEHPRRVAAVQDDRVLLLAPGEIRFAQADRHVVWLVTDMGRMRAVARGIENVAEELAPFGFVRVHRSYLVNVARIRELTHHGGGALTVSTQLTRDERIPVSRRSAMLLRETLGL